jgi:hypothetical protein
MSADIIQFIPRRPKEAGKHTDFPTIAFRSRVPDGPTRDAPAKHDLGTNHVDTAPCEYVQPDWFEK